MPYQPVNPCQTEPLNPETTEALYPDGAIPGNRVDSISSLCSYGLTPLVVTGALRQLLIQHFSDTRNVLNATLRNRLNSQGTWTPGPDTGLYIESLNEWRPELTESRPGIVIKEHDWNWQRMGINDRLREDYRSGRREFAGFWLGSHTCFVLGNEGAETQILATEVQKVLLWFREEIQRQLHLHQFMPLRLGAVAALKESTENYVNPVTVTYAFQEVWWLQQETPRLKRIVFRASDVLGGY